MSARRPSRNTPTLRAVAAFAGALVLFGAMVGSAHLGLGALATPVILTLAAGQAALVLWIFMHLRRSTTLIRLAAIAMPVWLALLFALSFLDWLTRP